MAIRKHHWMGILVASLLLSGTMTACSTVEDAGITSVEPTNAQSLENGTIVEIATFQLKEGVTPEEFYVLDQAVESQHVSQQPGFISRDSAVTEDNEWLAVVYWRSVEDAEASMASFSEAPATADFMNKLDAETMRMKRYKRF